MTAGRRGLNMSARRGWRMTAGLGGVKDDHWVGGGVI